MSARVVERALRVEGEEERAAIGAEAEALVAGYGIIDARSRAVSTRAWESEISSQLRFGENPRENQIPDALTARNRHRKSQSSVMCPEPDLQLNTQCLFTS